MSFRPSSLGNDTFHGKRLFNSFNVVPCVEIFRLNSKSTMAKLHITAIADKNLAKPAGVAEFSITVSITSSDGVPITDLLATNFVIGSEHFPVGSGPSAVSLFKPGRPGIYFFLLKPMNAWVWRSGQYIWSVTASRAEGRGQTLCSGIIP
jgi:hypothetical protein